MTADNLIHELDGDDNFLDELDDPQESVILESDNEFSDLEEIDEDNQEGNYIHIIANNKVIFASSMYQKSYLFFFFFLTNAYLSSTLHLST